MKGRSAPRQLSRILALGTLALGLISFPVFAQEEREREEREPRREREVERESERERGDREERRERAEPDQRRDRERPDQAERREREPRRDAAKLPPGLIGFSGQIGGIVEGKADGPALIVHVHKVHEVWDNNRADNPKALEGQRIRVGPAGQKNPLHLAFIKAFPVKEDCRLEIKHGEGNYFQILELSETQRKFARSKSGEPRERTRERDREPRRERADREEPRRDNSTEARIRRLEQEIERLKAELRESRGRREGTRERGRERER